MSVAFGIRQSGDVGTSDADIRHILERKWLNKGVVGGLAVKGSGSAYQVSAGMAICGRGGGDGFTEAYFPGGTTPAVAGNASSDPRIDAVWVTAHDASMGDADNLVAVGVTQGTPAASPAVPSIPGHATLIAAMRVPGGATAATSASSARVDYAIPYGASLGVLYDGVVTHNADWKSSGSIASGTFRIPTDRFLSFKVTVTAGANKGVYADGDGSVYVTIKVDGEIVDRREVRLRATGNAVSSFYEFAAEVGAGSHTVSMEYAINAAESIRMYWAKPGWAGQRLQVVDMGVAV